MAAQLRLQLRSVADDDLLRQLSDLVGRSRRVEAELVAHIGEVDRRRLYAREGSPSMFSYCVEKLHLSEAEAYLRITAARASRRHPPLLAMLGDGRLHLRGIVAIAPHLNEEDRDSILERAAYKPQREIDRLVAELAPKPDVPASVRKLPAPRPKDDPSQPRGRSKDVPSSVSPPTAPAQPALPSSAITPLAPTRYKIAFTASAELHEKLTRLRVLMRSLASSDLGAVIEIAVTEKLARLEAKRFGTTPAPRSSTKAAAPSASSRYIPASVRRAVRERDGNRCTFVSDRGERCIAQDALEFHHEKPYALGGDHSLANLSLMCPAHNTYLAERIYGRDVMDRHRSG